MNFSSFFINRPRFAVVIAIVMTLTGVIAGLILPISQYPDITPVQIVVSANYPGANATLLAETVATPIENQINGIEDMLYMSSTSTDTGEYTLTITFDIGVNADIAQVKVENRLDKAKPFLPDIVTQEGLNVVQQSANILAFVALTSPNGTYSPLYLSNFAFSQIQNPFKRINGMGDVNIYGPQYSIRIWMDVQKMNALNITSDQIISAIQSQNRIAGVGSLSSAPADDGTKQVLSLMAKGLLSSPKDFENIIIKSDLNGGIIRLKDISQIEMGADSYQLNASFNDSPSVVMSLNQRPNSNSIQVMNDLKKEMALLEKSFPEDMKFELVYDSTVFVRTSIQTILMTLLFTFVLVMIVIYLFLQNIKATLIPLVTIPVSLISTFVVIYLLGFDINILTLFAMILAIGLVVDDAIVVVERVQYLMKYNHLSSVEASNQAMTDITSSVIATTLVLLAIFVPVGLMAGMTGKIYQQFAVTLSTAIFFSAVNALTLSPVLCAFFLKKKSSENFRWMKKFNSVLDFVQSKYMTVARFLCTHIRLVLMMTFMTVGFLSFLFIKIPQEYIPTEDQGMILASIQLPSTSSINQTQEFLSQMSTEVRKIPGIRSFVGISGNSMLSASGENIGMAAIILTPWDERKTPALSMDNILNQLNRKYSFTSGIDVDFFAMPSIPGVGNADGITFQLNALNQNTTPADLSQTLEKLISFIRNSSFFSFGFSPYSSDTPHIFLDIDRTKLSTYQISLSDLFSVLQNNLGSRYVNNIILDGQVSKVIIQADFSDRKDQKDLGTLYVSNANGQLIQIKNFLKEKVVVMPKIIYRFNQYLSAGINAQTALHISSGKAISALQDFMSSLGRDYDISWTGLTLQQIKTQGLAVILISLAFIFSYLFLTALYESWWISFSVLLTNIFAISGALIGLEIWGLSLSIYAQLGIVMLIGLASKNAILIVQFILDYQRKGMEMEQAAIKGFSERFRAVVMTALTFILGTFPMVIASGAGSASQRSIGVTVFCGMIVAVAVGILFIPSYFIVFVRISLGKLFKKKTLKSLIIILFSGMLTSCMLGPDYQQPDFFSDKQIQKALDTPMSEKVNLTLLDLKDTTLNKLIDIAYQNSPTLKIALWRLYQSRLFVKMAQSKLLPTFDLTGQYNFVKDSKNMGLVLQDSSYQVGVDASWEIDIFGGTRRRIEAEKANLKSTIYSLLNIVTSTVSEVGRLYVQIRLTEELIRQTKENILVQEEMTALVQDKNTTGLASRLSLEQALYLLENTKASLADLEYQYIENKNALALILGYLPGEVDDILKDGEKSLMRQSFDFDLQKITALPVGILRQRPDVKSAEENLIAQNALVGAAIADLFPKFNFSVLFGYESLKAENLFNQSSLMHTITPSLTTPIFHFNALRENVEIQKLKKEELILTYEQALLNAVADVKNAIESLFWEYERYQNLMKTYQHANKVVELMQDKYKNGLIEYTDILQAQQNRIQAQIQMIQSHGNLYSDLIRFYKAVGGDSSRTDNELKVM